MKPAPPVTSTRMVRGYGRSCREEAWHGTLSSVCNEGRFGRPPTPCRQLPPRRLSAWSDSDLRADHGRSEHAERPAARPKNATYSDKTPKDRGLLIPRPGACNTQRDASD